MAVRGGSQQICSRGNENNVVAVGAHGVTDADGVGGDSGIWLVRNRNPNSAGKTAARDPEAGIADENIFPTASGERIVRRQVCGNRSESHKAAVRADSYGTLVAGAAAIRYRAVIGKRHETRAWRAIRRHSCTRVTYIDVSLPLNVRRNQVRRCRAKSHQAAVSCDGRKCRAENAIVRLGSACR